MKAIQYKRYGGPDVLETVDIPCPRPATDEVLIRIVASAVNPADLKWRSGMFEALFPLQLPITPGYDVAGVIEVVGKGVSGFTTGQQVVAMLDPLMQGGYAQKAAIPAKLLARVPEALSLDIAAAMPTAGLTGVQMIENHLDVEAGQRVLITGATGAVGRFAIFSALQRGAHVIAAVRGRQVALAKALGAHEVIDLDAQRWVVEPVLHVADTLGGTLCAKLVDQLATGDAVTVATDPVPGAAARFVQVEADTQRLEMLMASVVSGGLEVPIAQRLPLSSAWRAHRLVARGGLQGKLILVP